MMEYLKKTVSRIAPSTYRSLKASLLYIQGVITGRSPREIIFSTIYRKGGWGNPESLSGDGSILANTKSVRRELPRILQHYDVKVMLDIPCGDFHWMQKVDLGKTTYIGGDIVDALIEQNNCVYASTGKSFLHLDIVTSELPKADLVLCRDCLPHLPLLDVAAAMRNVKKSGARLILLSNYPSCRENTMVVTGKFRRLNFLLKPFLFPPPLAEFDDSDGIYPDKSLGLWRVADLPD